VVIPRIGFHRVVRECIERAKRDCSREEMSAFNAPYSTDGILLSAWRVLLLERARSQIAGEGPLTLFAQGLIQRYMRPRARTPPAHWLAAMSSR
jgi:hypothetical protein